MTALPESGHLIRPPLEFLLTSLLRLLEVASTALKLLNHSIVIAQLELLPSRLLAERLALAREERGARGAAREEALALGRPLGGELAS